MILSIQKRKFVLNRVKEIFDMGLVLRYNMSGDSFRTFELWYGSSNDDRIEFRFYMKNVENITFCNGNGKVVVVNDELLADEFLNLSNKMTEVVMNLDDIKFKKIFPDYDSQLERSMKLTDILGIVEDQVEDQVGEVEVECELQVDQPKSFLKRVFTFDWI
jgi:hypothetical protein